MLFKVSPAIFRDYPGAIIGIVVAHNIDNTASNEQVKALFEQVQNDLREQLAADTFARHTHIEPWIAAYKKFGAKPKKHIPSVQNLGQRVLKGPLPPINTLVDLYNIISLKYLLPAGGEDLATIKGDIELTIAGSQEQEVYLLGDKTPTKPEDGEVFYKDENGAICRRWNWKEADRTKLTPKTTDAFLVLEALPPVDPLIVEVAINELAKLIEHYCGGSATVAMIDQAHPSVVLRKGDRYCDLNERKDLSAYSFDIYRTVVPLEQSATEGSQEDAVRLEKTQKLRALGKEPWPAGKEVTATCQTVVDEFEQEAEKKVYALAGRMVAFREHGKTAFAHIQDQSGKLQVYFRKDLIGEESFIQLNQLIDIGDIIWVEGTSFRTKMGEITLQVTAYALLSKCLHALPEKFHGLSDIETIYRQRYLDLISNPESKKRFIQRSKIVRAMRSFFDSRGYLEVETPMLHPIPGGAAARPFVTHHNALDMTLYMRIAPELFLKRLVVGGLDRVYEINRNFRNEGISTRHNPEFTMVEFYTAYKDYHYAMDMTEDIIRAAVTHTSPTMQLPYGDYVIDYGAPFTRMSMRDAVKHYGSLSDRDLSTDHIDETLKKHAIVLDNKHAAWGYKLAALFEKLAESKLIQPTFITHFPIEISPLAKRDENDPMIAARFELFIGGMEVSNGFNELNDPFDQADRFKDQVASRESGDAEAHHYDADYITALEYALPPTAGVGIGIDRLVMLLTNTTSIKDVILFPTLKHRSK